jgi:hypothetical protein
VSAEKKNCKSNPVLGLFKIGLSNIYYAKLTMRCCMRRRKVLFSFQEILPEITEFLQDGSDLHPQLNDSRWLIVLRFQIYLTAKRNELNTELQGEN